MGQYCETDHGWNSRKPHARSWFFRFIIDLSILYKFKYFLFSDFEMSDLERDDDISFRTATESPAGSQVLRIAHLFVYFTIF